MSWYIILYIGLLPFVMVWVVTRDWATMELLLAFFLFVGWVTVVIGSIIGEFSYVKSSDPITPELRITVIGSVEGGQRDTMYIYR